MSRRHKTTAAVQPPAPPSGALRVTERMLMDLQTVLPQELRREFSVPSLPPGVLPKGAKYALDSAGPMLNWMNTQGGFCGLGFPGFTYLAELSQRSEYRAPTETIANEMTREWITLSGASEDKLKELYTTLTDFDVRESFRKMALMDGFFGRGMLFISVKGQDSDIRRQQPLLYGPETIKKGSLVSLKPIEPIWTTPYMYNAIDPTKPSFYEPEAWYVMGKRTHATRFLTFISHPLPDMLKPAYNFSGMSLSQLIEPYVKRWLSTVDSVNRMIGNYSISGIKTNMMSMLEGSADESPARRAQLFNATRKNGGVMMLDKDSEEFFQFNTPLNALPDLQAQAQEHMAAPTHIPLVKLTGITPSGLNASSEGELKVFYDFISGEQKNVFDGNLRVVLQLLQLHLWGAVDENIAFRWNQLDAPSEKDLADMRQKDAAAASIYLTQSVISPDEQRESLKATKHSGYEFLTGKAPEPKKETPPGGGSSEKDGGKQGKA